MTEYILNTFVFFFFDNYGNDYHFNSSRCRCLHSCLKALFNIMRYTFTLTDVINQNPTQLLEKFTSELQTSELKLTTKTIPLLPLAGYPVQLKIWIWKWRKHLKKSTSKKDSAYHSHEIDDGIRVHKFREL